MTSPAAPRVALLRGINVGKDRRIAMADLRRLAGGLGWTSVATHLQSGNLVFEAAGDDRSVAEALRGRISAAFGLEVDVVIRDLDRLDALLADNPFAQADPSKAVIACCDRRIEQAALARLERLRAGDEDVRIAASGCDLFAIFPDGQARSKLAAALISSLTPATGTARNLRTVAAVADLLRAEPGR